MKGGDRDIPRLFVGLTIIDLSNNYFESGIPEIIGNLRALKVLNLSHNSLNGRIPDSLGKLSEIESLDLSSNQLTGNIPQSLAGINGLEVLDLSQNHLVGRIPEGTHFTTFDESSFAGNLGLCGFQLPKKCSDRTHKPQLEEHENHEDKSGFTWEVVTLGYGCGTLLGLVMGYLMLSTRKVKWFNLIADAGERLILERNKRRYVEEFGEASDLFSYSDVYQLLLNYDKTETSSLRETAPSPYVPLAISTLASDEDDSDTEEEEAIGKQEVAPPVSNQVKATT
ncbi:leucine-rich repeat-containing protein [Tanacetum coccineum]